jgi:hypothetical protein
VAFLAGVLQVSANTPRQKPSTSKELDLFDKEAFSPNSGDYSYNNYNKMIVAGFFTYLKEEWPNNCTADLLTKSKTFLNTHLRADFESGKKKEGRVEL